MWDIQNKSIKLYLDLVSFRGLETTTTATKIELSKNLFHKFHFWISFPKFTEKLNLTQRVALLSGQSSFSKSTEEY